DLLKGDAQAVPRQHSRVQTARDVAELVEREGDLTLHPVEPRACRRMLRELVLQQLQLERERDQPCLRTVVEIALEPLAFLPPRIDHPRPRALQLLDARGQLCLQPPVLERN